jgi:anti-sigma regulatory factor (Ser/Thr protein kinase)/ActR/RegA family two-component response regulator
MKRILVIDDDPASSWLSRVPPLPYELDAAQGSADALRRLRRRAYDVIVTSPRTHVNEDLALLEEARRIRPAVKAVVLAPSASPPDIIAAMRAQVFGCLTAPLDPGEIADLVLSAADAQEWDDDIQVLSARPEWIALRVTCSLVTADRLGAFMTALRTDLPQPVREDLLIAFREVLLNAMEHGAGFDADKVIEVAAVRTRRAVVYYFRDPGPGFDVTTLGHAAVAYSDTDPIAHLERRQEMGLRPGGFGILIVRQLVDEVIYSESGNEVLLIKHLV